MAKIYVRARVEAHRAWCQDSSPSTVCSDPSRYSFTELKVRMVALIAIDLA